MNLQKNLLRQILAVGMFTIVILVLIACGEGSSAQQEKQKANKVHHIPEDSNGTKENLSLLGVT
jgi:hypothetical protein